MLLARQRRHTFPVVLGAGDAGMSFSLVVPVIVVVIVDARSRHRWLRAVLKCDLGSSAVQKFMGRLPEIVLA